MADKRRKTERGKTVGEVEVMSPCKGGRDAAHGREVGNVSRGGEGKEKKMSPWVRDGDRGNAFIPKAAAWPSERGGGDGGEKKKGREEFLENLWRKEGRSRCQTPFLSVMKGEGKK